MRYKELAQRFDIPFPDGMHRAQQAQAEQAHDAALHAAVTPLMADPAIPILCVGVYYSVCYGKRREFRENVFCFYLVGTGGEHY